MYLFIFFWFCQPLHSDGSGRASYGAIDSSVDARDQQNVRCMCQKVNNVNLKILSTHSPSFSYIFTFLYCFVIGNQ